MSNVLLTLEVVTSKELEKNREILRERFIVDPTSQSGLRMKIKNGARNRKVMRWPGDVAGFVGKDARNQPRWEVGIKKTYLKVSRIIWILSVGPIPKGLFVDHKDGNPLNNCLENLQLLSNAQNLRALNSPYSCNKTGYLGVFKRPNRSWYVAMRRHGKLHYLGSFSTPIAAARRYNKAVIEWAEEHGETPRYLNPV